MASIQKMAKELDTTDLVATEGIGPRVHVAASGVANVSSSRVDIATRSTEAKLSGALSIVNGVHQVETDFDLSQGLRDHMMENEDEEGNFPLDEGGRFNDYDDVTTFTEPDVTTYVF